MNVNIKENINLVLFIVQFLIVAPLLFYFDSLLNDYRKFKEITIEKIYSCITHEQLEMILKPIWLIIIDDKNNINNGIGDIEKLNISKTFTIHTNCKKGFCVVQSNGKDQNQD